MNSIFIIEKAVNEIKLKNKSEKIEKDIQNMFSKIGKRVISKIYEYLFSLNEALPQILLNKYI